MTAERIEMDYTKHVKKHPDGYWMYIIKHDGDEDVYGFEFPTETEANRVANKYISIQIERDNLPDNHCFFNDPPIDHQSPEYADWKYDRDWIAAHENQEEREAVAAIERELGVSLVDCEDEKTLKKLGCEYKTWARRSYDGELDDYMYSAGGWYKTPHPKTLKVYANYYIVPLG